MLGGSTNSCAEIGFALYDQIISKVVIVSSTKAAEFTKLLENIHRCVNIGLMNELKPLADRMGIDIYEVIRAAATKPFGFVPYYPWAWAWWSLHTNRSSLLDMEGAMRV